jgi:hypothetical protein
MQISASSLLASQIAKPQQQQGFQPMEFKAAAPTRAVLQAPSGPAQRPGANLDIRV